MSPNWCDCELIVKGPRNIRKHFMEFATSKDKEDNKDQKVLDMNQFIPYPRKEFDDAATGAQNGYNCGGYNWCCENWGTKWNFCDVELKETKSSLHYHFQTAWSPPIPVIVKMSELYPHLVFTLKYYEQGRGFAGILTIKEKKLLKRVENNAYQGGRGG